MVFTPLEPLVSTLILTSIFQLVFQSISSHIRMCDTVGQAVTARTYGSLLSLACSLAEVLATAPEAFASFSCASASSSLVASSSASSIICNTFSGDSALINSHVHFHPLKCLKV